MPREVYRDLITRRFISRSEAEQRASTGLDFLRELYDAGQQIESQRYGEEAGQAEREERPVGNWDAREYQHGLAWTPNDGSEVLNLDALQETDMPWGMEAWRVRYAVPQMDPRYPTGFASSDWMPSWAWPPSLDLAQNVRNPIGIAMIHFDTEP